MKLYTYWRSSCSWRVRIALNLKGLDYELHPVHLVKNGGEQHSEWYREVNPQAQLPTLELTDGTHLTQSMAIMMYLDHTTRRDHEYIRKPRNYPFQQSQCSTPRSSNSEQR